MFQSEPPKHVDGSVLSQWEQPINPEVNKIEGNYEHTADSHVIVGNEIENIKRHSSVLSIALIVIAVLFIIHFVTQLYKAIVRRAERNKTSSFLSQQVPGEVPTAI